MSSLRRGRANLLRIVPILTDDTRMEIHEHLDLLGMRIELYVPRLDLGENQIGEGRNISNQLIYEKSHSV